jgi:hypothetical protein
MLRSRAKPAQHVVGSVAQVPRHDYAGTGSDHENLPASHLTMTAVLPGAAVPDYLLTCAVAGLDRQPRLLPGVCFPFVRMLDAATSLYPVPAAWLSVSSGRWMSPSRRPAGRAAPALLPAAAGVPAGGPYRTGTSDEPGAPARMAEASHVSG